MKAFFGLFRRKAGLEAKRFLCGPFLHGLSLIHILQLKRVVRLCLIVILGCSVMTLGAALLFAPGLVGIFAGRDTSVYPIALHGFYLFSLSYLFLSLIHIF